MSPPPGVGVWAEFTLFYNNFTHPGLVVIILSFVF